MTSPFAHRSDSLRAGTLATSFLLIGLCATAPALAEPQRSVELSWEAPQGCPQESEVRNRIQKILGSRRHDNLLRAEGTITRRNARYRLELVVQVGDVTGTRGLTSKSCENLAGAAAVEIGLLVHSVEDESTPQPTGTETTISSPVGGSETAGSHSDEADGRSSQPAKDASHEERAPEVAKSENKKEEVEREAEEQPPETEAETSRSWHALVQAPALALGVGPLPSTSLGAGLALGLEYAHWQLQLQGLLWRRQNVPASGLPGYGVDVDRIGARLWTCREIRFSWFGLSPCLAAAMERVSASGTGSNISPTTQHTIDMSVGAGVQSRIHIASWIRLLLAVAGEVELYRPEISIDRLGQIAPPPTGEPADPPTSIYRFAPAALTVTLSLEWAL
jgi:hypothetical protein